MFLLYLMEYKSHFVYSETVEKILDMMHNGNMLVNTVTTIFLTVQNSVLGHCISVTYSIKYCHLVLT